MASLKGFWKPLEKLLEQMDQNGFIHSGDKLRPVVVDNIEEIVPLIQELLAA
jgi:predicted Rossmann-fold nucleotide-binding protein